MWHVYILQCEDGSLYTGITTDIKRRFAEHATGQGGRYTRSRKPVAICYQEQCYSRADAQKREYQIKQLSREAKKQLIQIDSK